MSVAARLSGESVKRRDYEHAQTTGDLVNE
jgi:hypothetical protein